MPETEATDPGEPWEYWLHIPNDPRAVTISRRTLRLILTLHGLTHLADTAELLATELVSNAVRHTKGPAALRVRWSAGVLRIGAWDASLEPPEPPAPLGQFADAEDGRGLALVRACADLWGWQPLGRNGHRGKYVWCDLVAAQRVVTFDAHDPRALSSFWRDLLGYLHPGPPGVDLPEDADPLAAWDDFLARVGVPEEQRSTRSAIEDPDGHGPRLFFQQVPEDKTVKNRVHLDVRVAPGLRGEERMAALEVECDRLVALGATRVRRHEPAPPMSVAFLVMTGPEGNEFCLD